MIDTAEKLRILAIAKEIRAVILMHAEPSMWKEIIQEAKKDQKIENFDQEHKYAMKIYIDEYVRDVLEIARALEEYIQIDSKKEHAAAEKKKQNIVTIWVSDGKEKTVDRKEQLKMLGFAWDPKKKAWHIKVKKEKAQELIFAKELEGLKIEADKELK